MSTRAHCMAQPGMPPQPCESMLERKGLILLSQCPFTIRVLTQPTTLKLVVEGKPKLVSYTPDFKLETTIGQFLGETKPISELFREDVQLRLQAAEKLALELGYDGFIKLTEREIKLQPRLDNSMIIKHYRNCPVNPDLIYEIQDLVAAGSGVTMTDIQGKFGLSGKVAALRLLADRRIVGDMLVPVNEGMPLWNRENTQIVEAAYADIFHR